MQLMFLDKINKDSYKPEVVSFFRVTVRIALLRVSLAIAFRWAWIQANPVRCAIRLGLDPREAMWWLFAPPRAVAVQSPPVRACQFPDRVSGPVAKLIQLLLELDHGTTCR